jgi:hypothetical protein
MTDTNPPADRIAENVAEIRSRVEAYRTATTQDEKNAAQSKLQWHATWDLGWLLSELDDKAARVEELEGQLAETLRETPPVERPVWHAANGEPCGGQQ